MATLIAIGGGEIGRPGTKIETRSIDIEIIKQSGKKNPALLFIPTASSDSQAYTEIVKKYFGDILGCKVDVLYLLEKKYSREFIKKSIMSADIIYVGGGNTQKMIEVWKKNGVDILLKQAYRSGTILSGLSAGAICWFRYGNSDSPSFTKKNSSLVRVNGLGLVNLLLCPHYDIEKKRKLSLKKMMKNTPGVAVALDNCVALEIVDDTFRILSSKKNVHAYKVFWSQGVYCEQKILQKKTFEPINNLFLKE